jgi:Quinohemoprotein amine dehydrogenase, alpha subunit domain III/IPT/TIG domain
VRGQGANGGAFAQSITMNGTGFTPGALADFGAGVTVKFTTFVDATHLTAHIVVASDAQLGTRSVTVSLPDGRSSVCAACFTVVAGPHVSDIAPNGIGPGAQRTVTVTGDNFTATSKVTVPASGVAVTSVTLVDANHLSVGLSTALAAPAGSRDLIVTNVADAGSTSCSGCFSVTPGPVVTDVSPDRTVNVANADGGRGSCATCFAVNAAPTVTGITPSTLGRGTSTAVTTTGTNFVDGATVSMRTGVTVTDVVAVDANTITATATVSASTGIRAVYGSSVALPFGFIGDHSPFPSFARAAPCGAV